MSGGVVDIPDVLLAGMWRGIDWAAYENTLSMHQRNIAFAAMRWDVEEVTRMQKRLVRSFEAKALAVRHVSSHASQPGIDRVKWKTDVEKMRAVHSITSKRYKASPMRSIFIMPDGRDKERNVQIPTFYDRAMQTLYAYALDPVSEATADKKSFAFRKGRAAHDAHVYIIKALNVPNPPRYVLKADVKACYATIGHDWLLRNIPICPRVLSEFLKCGHVYAGELFPADDWGISIGSSISPILANMTLDGAQHAIHEGLHGGSRDFDYSDGDLLRFADDMLITARTMESAERIMAILADFLRVRGLVLNEEKTYIVDVDSRGFDFLSRRYCRIGGVVFGTPSETAITKMENKLRDVITPYEGSQKKLIDKLNRMFIGWAHYHRIADAEPAFRRIDNVSQALLLELCERLKPNMPRMKIIDRYFYKETDGGYSYSMSNKRDERVYRLASTILVRHQPMNMRKNPYIHVDYFEERAEAREIASVTGKYKIIWRRQRGRCFYCGRTILVDEEKSVVPVDPAGNLKSHRNLVYVHEYCARGEVEYYRSDADISCRFDFYELLMKMAAGGHNTFKGGNRGDKFKPLAEYFRRRCEAVFTLTFAEIEMITGRQLCGSASLYNSYWQQRGEKNISHCWHSNNYEIKSIDINKGYIVFKRVGEIAGSIVDVPEVFLHGRVPHNAKAELDNAFAYVRKKYGL